MSAPPAYEQEERPLPDGWLKQWDSNYKRSFWVDTKAKPPRSIWTHPLDDEEYQRSAGRHSPYPSPTGAPPPSGDQSRMFGMGSSNRPQGSYGSGMAPQGYNGPPPQQGYYPPQNYGPPPQQQYYQQQQQPMYQQPPRRSGFGGMGMPLALGGGLLGGALLGSAFADHENYEQQQAYDQGYDNGFDQGQDGGDFGGGGNMGGGDFGGGDFGGGF